jgi:hypothetical protein
MTDYKTDSWLLQTSFYKQSLAFLVAYFTSNAWHTGTVYVRFMISASVLLILLYLQEENTLSMLTSGQATFFLSLE